MSRAGPVVPDLSFWVAIGACLGATTCYAVSSIYMKKYAAGAKPIAIAGWSQIFAALALAPFVPFAPPTSAVTPLIVGNVLLLALLCSSIAYVLYYRLIADIGPTRALTMAFLMPAFGMLWGALFLDEPITLPMIAGCALVIGGATAVLRPAPAAAEGYDGRCSVASCPQPAASCRRAARRAVGSSPPACSSPRCSARWPPRRCSSTAKPRKPRSSAQLTTLIGGDFRYATLDVKVWPRPTAELRQVTFRVAPVVEGTAERMVRSVCVSAAPQRRRARFRRSFSTGRRWSLRLPATRRRAVSRTTPSPRTAARSDPALEWLALHARGLALSVRDGTIDLDMPGGRSRSSSMRSRWTAWSPPTRSRRRSRRTAISWQARAGSREDRDRLPCGEPGARDRWTGRGVSCSSVVLGGIDRHRLHPAATDCEADGADRRPAFGHRAGHRRDAGAWHLTRNAARVEIGPSRARLEASTRRANPC